MKDEDIKSVAIIVAKPDDEALWAGGTILSHPHWNFFVISLSHANDPDLAPRFYNALNVLNAEGTMGDLDDESTGKPLNERELRRTILQLLPSTHFDLVITHNISNEENKNIRHDEIHKAVTGLWNEGKISTCELWTFAYEHGSMKYFPETVEEIPVKLELSESAKSEKYKIITRIFGLSSRKLQSQDADSSETFWKVKFRKAGKSSDNELSIFSAPSIESLKFLYRKSMFYKFDRNRWTNEFENVKGLNWQSNEIISNRRYGKDLYIFKSPSIENLKLLYYKSLIYLFERNTTKPETTTTKEMYWQSKYYIRAKKSLKYIGKELNIFKTPTIESLKSMYNKSMSYVFEPNKYEVETTVRGFDDKLQVNGDTSNVQHSNDMKIFNLFSIDNLKSLYNGRKE